MSKTEMLRQSAQAKNETRLQDLANQVQAVSQARHQSVEDLASMLEPLAQTMASLTDQTKDTLVDIQARTEAANQVFLAQLVELRRSLKYATAPAQKAAESLNQAGIRMEWRFFGLAMAIAAFTAVLVSAFWLWAYPPTVQNNLDPKAVADYLKPAVIEALKPSKGR